MLWLTGGLFSVAVAIAWSAWLLHRDVVRVYYPQVKWARDQHELELFPGVAHTQESEEDNEVEKWLDKPLVDDDGIEDEELYDHDDQGRRIDVR